MSPQHLAFLESTPVFSHGNFAPIARSLHPSQRTSCRSAHVWCARRPRLHIHASATSTSAVSSHADDESSVERQVTQMEPCLEKFLSDDAVTDEVLSDDTHVVIDGNDIAHLIDKLRQAGQDDLGISVAGEGQDEGKKGDRRRKAPSDGDTTTAREKKKASDRESDEEDIITEFLDAAEQLSDERDGRDSALSSSPSSSSLETPSESTSPSSSISTATQVVNSSANSIDTTTTSATLNKPVERQSDDAAKDETMEYFVTENVALMPSWVRDMYESNTHDVLQDGADELLGSEARQRLHDIVSQRHDRDFGEISVEDLSLGEGIVDCTVSDVAADYAVPVEFVVDAMLSFGVPIPISGKQSIRNSMTSEEIERLLKVITSFDKVDLDDRYSDRTVEEVSEDYDLKVEKVLRVCDKEGLYLHSGKDTHLSKVRENRVLDILIKNEPLGKPYPPLLEGLE